MGFNLKKDLESFFIESNIHTMLREDIYDNRADDEIGFLDQEMKNIEELLFNK